VSSLTATEAMAELLRQAKDLTEIRDAAGKVIGVFTPMPTAEPATKGMCYTTKQVFERLLSLTNDPNMRANLQEKIEMLVERDACVSQ